MARKTSLHVQPRPFSCKYFQSTFSQNFDVEPANLKDGCNSYTQSSVLSFPPTKSKNLLTEISFKDYTFREYTYFLNL